MCNLFCSIFSTEIILVVLALGVLIFDIFLPDNRNRGKALTHTAMAGVGIAFINLVMRGWGNFGNILSNSFVQDGLSFYFKIIFLLAGFFVLFMARVYQPKLERGHGEFVLLILFGLVGLTFLASANDFLLFFVALETLTISLYVMTSYLRKDSHSIEAGVKYLVLGALSTALFLYGLSFVYGATGSTNFTEIYQKLSLTSSIPMSFVFGSILIISSLGFKIASVPFQFWTPDIYEGAPSPVAAYLAIASKAAGFSALLRLMLTVFAPIDQKLFTLFAVLSALTIIYGNLGAIPQTNIKRLLGYSSIGHAGYLMIGLAAFPTLGKEAVLYYLLSYLFSTGGAFLVVVILANHFETEKITEYAGLARKSPILAATMLLSLLSLAGVPPLAGFFAKFYLLFAAVKSGNLLWLVVIGVLNVITSLYYYLKVVKVMYIDAPSNNQPLAISVSQKSMLYLAIAGILTLGIFQGPFVRLVTTVFSN